MNAPDSSSPPEQQPQPTSPRKTGIIVRLRRYFLTGVLVTAPITITLYLTYIFFHFVDTKVSGILPQEVYDSLYGQTTFPGLGILMALVFFVTVGWFATNFMGRLVIRISEYILARVPIINTLYNSVKQVFETLMGSQAQAFREVVMIEYPRKDSWTLGFVTGVTEGEIQNATDDELVNVFVPTAPSPVNGFLLFIPRRDMIPLKMTVEEGIKMVISTGIITPTTKKIATEKK